MEYHKYLILVLKTLCSTTHIGPGQRPKNCRVLTRGLRFCLPPKSVNPIDIKCSFELLYRDLLKLGHALTDEDKDRLKCHLKNVSYRYVYSYNYTKKSKFSARRKGKHSMIYEMIIILNSFKVLKIL